MPKVTVIPATKTFQPITANDVSFKKRKVAAYARVSTDSEEQETSYEAQIKYYTDYIKSRADWEFVKMYSDKAVTGTSTKRRKGFLEMVNDALAGKIDLIITKSVSRFSRNTVDSLVTIRKLKEKGIEVYFEKENIYTLDSKGEVLLTIMSSLAQDESRSISDNVTWGKRKASADGKIYLPYKQFLGYKRGEDKLPKVIPEEAEIVRRIYREFMLGKTPYTIATELTEDGVPTASQRGKEWNSTTIISILTNEKYKGSAILQKTFTVDFLTKKTKKNEGEIPQYYVENSHEAIIPPEEFEIVQQEIARRKGIGRSYSGNTVFSSRIICGDCGSYYGTKVWHSNDKYRKTVYLCNKKSPDNPCKTQFVTEEELKRGFIEAMNGVMEIKEMLLRECEEIHSVLSDTVELDVIIRSKLEEQSVVSEMIRKAIEKNSRVSQDQAEFWKEYNSLEERYKNLDFEVRKLTTGRDEKVRKGDLIMAFMKELSSRDNAITEFEPRLFIIMVETITVKRNKVLSFKFRNGLERDVTIK